MTTLRVTLHLLRAGPAHDGTRRTSRPRQHKAIKGLGTQVGGIEDEIEVLEHRS